MNSPALFVGCAGWSIPKQARPDFPGDGSHLERYAQRLPSVEINSSFYRPHRPATYARWADAVPPDFRFAVKVPKAITHEAKLAAAENLLDRFLAEVGGLGGKLGVLLVQLPPGLRFDAEVAGGFFDGLRERHTGGVACEPRHPSWFAPEAATLLRRRRIARVAADPAPIPAAAVPGGWQELSYHRLHGSPEMYRSEYSEEFLERLVGELTGRVAAGVEAWCVFDNTAAGFAMPNALSVLRRLTGNRTDGTNGTDGTRAGRKMARR